MKRGEVWWVNFTTSDGGEIQKKRPSVIISNDSANKHLNRVQVVPITSNVTHLYPSEAYIVLNGKKNKAMTDQITTVSKERLSDPIGILAKEDMQKIENALKKQLGIDDF